jgi:MtrB/PioB family decaheme-associated outer membrane protein
MGFLLHRHRLSLLMLALLAAFAAHAEDEVAKSKATGSVTVGVGAVSGDRADRGFFGQYSGWREHRAIGLFGADYERIDEQTGHTVRFEASELLNENRALDLRWRSAGDWSLRAGYREQVRHDPLDVSTGADLSLKRSAIGVSFTKVLGSRWQAEAALSSEDKDGQRLFGIGFTCPSALAPTCGGTTGIQTGWAVLMIPEPVKANHTQASLRVSYAGDGWRWSAGYHGSFYRNELDRIDPSMPSSLNNPLGTPLPASPGLLAILSQPVALAPDNQAHQFDLGGSYDLARHTHFNYTLAYSQLTQHQDFAASGFTQAPTGVANLGARVDTTLAQLGLTSRPVSKLSLAVKLRYEDRDDKTPLAFYNVEGTSTYTNRRLPNTKTKAQLQADWQFTPELRGTIAGEDEKIDRGVFTASSAIAGVSALRQKTDETTLRVELRRRLGDSWSGAIGVSSSRRGGSNWLRDNSGTGVTEVPDPNDPSVGLSTAIFMPTVADRRRDVVKLSVDWQPTDKLALQMLARSGRDSFSTPSRFGLRGAGNDFASIDASYAIDDSWNLNGNLGMGNETLYQVRPGATALSYSNRSTSAALGFNGKLLKKVEVGGSLAYSLDRSVYAQTLDATADTASAALLAATGGLPDIVWRQTTLKLFGRYELDKRSALRLELAHQRTGWSDWSWAYNGVPFVYGDGTIVSRQPRQRVSFIGVTYSIRWP